MVSSTPLVTMNAVIKSKVQICMCFLRVDNVRFHASNVMKRGSETSWQWCSYGVTTDEVSLDWCISVIKPWKDDGLNPRDYHPPSHNRPDKLQTLAARLECSAMNWGSVVRLKERVDRTWTFIFDRNLRSLRQGGTIHWFLSELFN